MQCQDSRSRDVSERGSIPRRGCHVSVLVLRGNGHGTLWLRLPEHSLAISSDRLCCVLVLRRLSVVVRYINTVHSCPVLTNGTLKTKEERGKVYPGLT